MSLTLDVVRGGTEPYLLEPVVVLAVPHIDPDPTIQWLEDLYWSSGDKGFTTKRWKHENAENFYRGIERLRTAFESHLMVPVGTLHLAKVHGDTGDIQDFGLVSAAVVTDVGCQKIVAVMNASDAVTGVNFKFHAIGTGVAAEAATDTTLGTELTTQYNPDNTRATGTQTTGSTTKVYRTVATNTLDSGSPAVTEHGAMSAATAGSLLDRSVFSAINLVGANGDGIQSTYDLTFTSGG